jgi:aspartate/methionine/tyrosine aminotransferase
MIQPNIKGLVPSATLRINEYSNQLEREGKTVYKLGFGQSPFPVPQVMVEAMQQHAHEKAYLPVKGLMALREAVANYYQRSQNLNCTAENILIAPGSKMFLFAVQLAFDGALILPAPSWVSYAPQAQIIGKKAHWIPTTEANGWLLTANELDDFCKNHTDRKILLLNYPNNPTGTTYSSEQLKSLAAIARKYDLLIMSDEIYGELHHEGQHVSMACFAPERTIITSGLSKWAGAGGWRMGTVVFPKELDALKNAVSTIASETYTTTSAPIQYGAVPAFEDLPELENYRQAARKILKYVGCYTYEAFQNMNITTPKPEGGFYSFINFEQHRERLAQKGITSSTTLSNRLLQETGIALLPSIDFGRQNHELIFRMAYVDFDGKQALDAVQSDYQDKKLDMNFLNAYAPKMKIAMEKLAKWLV